ncbi:MAG: PBP1A family penicillin-binding protein [Candidatus Colwellbacteria bacterium]|nr:PBP1A family penicillin-binding protein [Candidatus Colwellbacteria bacterium]
MKLGWLRDEKVRKQLLVGGVGLSLALVLYVVGIFISLPKPEEITSILQAAESVQIYDRTGEILLSEAAGDKQRSILPREEIPDHIRQATVAIEDADFYSHGAFEWKGVLRAIVVNITRGRLAQGGSTITQQLARNAFLTPEKTVTRKVKEGVLAVRLEQYYSKDEILDLYLNHIPYGRNYYGVEAASQAFFNKPAKELTLAEAALVAAIPQAPTYYSPWGDHKNELMERKNLVLKRMESEGYIDEERLSATLKEEVKFARQPVGVVKAPHFVNYVQEYLTQKYGEDVVATSDLKVITSLDWELQEIAEDALRKGVEKNDKRGAGSNGAFMAMDPQTGQILAMVGSKDYYAKPEPEGCTEGKTCRFEGNFNVATQGLRQPGSAFKPFVYLAAFERGLTPDTLVWDSPTEFNTGCPAIPNFSAPEGSCYHPQNFDRRFRGPVKLKEALAQSINVPAVKVLYVTGVGNAIETAKRFGVTTLTDPRRYGLSLVLGGGEIKLSEMISAYSVLAAEGTYHAPTGILRIEDAEGKVLEEYKDKKEEVVDSQYPRLINQILSSGELRSPLYSASFGLTQVPGYEVAMKTGTTDNYVDAWTFGYTPNLVAGVWVGNNNQLPTDEGSSILAALPIWHEFMAQAVPKRPYASFNSPAPAPADNPILRGELPDGNHDLLYYLGRGGEAQSAQWEASVQGWLQGNSVDLSRFAQMEDGQASPAEPHGQNGALSIEFLSPQNGEFVGQGVKLELKVRSSTLVRKVEIYLNDRLIDIKTGDLGKEFYYKKSLSSRNLKSQNLLVVRAENEAGGKIEEEIVFFTE